MLFVDDDEAQILEGQEERRTCTGHHADLAGRHLAPYLFAGAGRKIRMPFAGLGAEAILEALEEVGGERDFRQQDQHLLSLFQGLGNRFK